MEQDFTVQKLDITHLAAVMNLQDKIIANFHADEKHFILKRSATDFMKALDNENSHMIGIFDGDKLIAQSIFEFPTSMADRDMPEFAAEIAPTDLVIYKATLVDMDYRGHGLMQKLLNYRENQARLNGKTTAISQIAMDNPASWINALKNGMSIRKVDRDPFDDAKVLYMQKDFDREEPVYKAENMFVMSIGKDIHKEIPALFNKMRHIAQLGYRGLGLDKEKKAIIWGKPEPEQEKSYAINYDFAFADALGRTTRH
jgi:GNAT superfamily N-acetyltransferase